MNTTGVNQLLLIANPTIDRTPYTGPNTMTPSLRWYVFFWFAAPDAFRIPDIFTSVNTSFTLSPSKLWISDGTLEAVETRNIWQILAKMWINWIWCRYGLRERNEWSILVPMTERKVLWSFISFYHEKMNPLLDMVPLWFAGYEERNDWLFFVSRDTLERL